MFRAFVGHPIKRARAHVGNVFAFGPEKTDAVWAEEPFVSGANQKIGAERFYVQRHCATTLADVQKQQRTLGMAGGGNTRGVKERSVIKAHQTGGNETGARGNSGDEIVGGNK